MKPLPDYTKFKHKLLTNPRWLARALVVLAFEIKPRGISLESAIELAKVAQAVRDNGGEFLWEMDSKTGKWATNFVRKQAPSVYNFAKKQRESVERCRKATHEADDTWAARLVRACEKQ